jgi:organic radical activating enzyme
MIMKLRLVITMACPRSCEGCCNKQFDWSTVPVLESVADIPKDCDMVLITGGEPMLYPERTAGLAHGIKWVRPDVKVIVYTAGLMNEQRNRDAFALVSPFVDGFTYTVHEPLDKGEFLSLVILHENLFREEQSLRVNVFSPITLGNWDSLHNWHIIEGYEWIDDCPTPDDEVLMQWKSVE